MPAKIATKVDAKHLEQTLVDNYLRKFTDLKKALFALIAAKHATLAGVE